MKNKYAKFLNKSILVGITYLDKDGSELAKKQFHGLIKTINDNTTVIKINSNDEDFSIPTDIRNFEKAEPGIYKLKSTGEMVENPDFVTSWTVTKPKPLKKLTKRNDLKQTK